MTHNFRYFPTFALILLLGITTGAGAQQYTDLTETPVATVRTDPGQVVWQPQPGVTRLSLRVTGPEDFAFTDEFGDGRLPVFRAQDVDGNALPDGDYNYEIWEIPKNFAVRSETTEAQESSRNSENRYPIQSGTFKVLNGAIVVPNLQEPSTGAKGPIVGTNAAAPDLSLMDQVINDDLIVTQSICVGSNCVSGEVFGAEELKIKEDNTRLKFIDTSDPTSALSFPHHDWQLTANSSDSGGAERFTIEDITAVTVPFTIAGSAPTNSLFVSSSGNVGFGTSTPVLDLHAASADTPALRLEQTGVFFPAQTWDVGGYEGSFFVRDITGGSTLPFQIRAGAPSSSIDISAVGNVGLGATSPSAKLHVNAPTDQDLLKLSVGSATKVTVNKDGHAMFGSALAPSSVLEARQGGIGFKVTEFNGNAWFIIDGADGDFTGGDYAIIENTGLSTNFYNNAQRRLQLTDSGVNVIGHLSKSSGSFKIDHPLDPANKYLYHSFVESPDMLNIYNGNVRLDEEGRAIVSLPEWFEALNTDFRYQLTPVGAPAPNIHVARGVEDGTFEIAGGLPTMTVSWLVTGIRNDPYALANRVPVETDKPLAERGTFLFPGYYEEEHRVALHDDDASEEVIATKNAEIRDFQVLNSELSHRIDQLTQRLQTIEKLLLTNASETSARANSAQ